MVIRESGQKCGDDSGVEFDPDGDVIGRFFATPDSAFDPAIFKQISSLRCQQVVVDANAVISLPGPGLVVPERVVFGASGAGAEGFCEAEVEEFSEGGAGLGAGKRVFLPDLGTGGVFVLGYDVVIAAHNRGFFCIHKGLGACLHAVHPGERVVVFWAWTGVAIGQVETADADWFFVANDSRFDPAGLFVTVVAGQAVGDVFQRQSREDGYAVEALLSMGFNGIA